MNVSIDLLESGMTLEKPVLNKFEQVLLPIGTELTDRHIRLLKTWNIDFVEVRDREKEEELGISDEAIAEAIEAVSRRMNWRPANQYENDIFQMGVLNLAEKKMRAGK